MKFLFSLLLLVSLFGCFYFAPKIIIVPHHNLVASLRSRFINQVRLRHPFIKKIVVIGPDHFSLNQKKISYTDLNWFLGTGIIPFDQTFDAFGLSLDNFTLKNDHTTYNLLSDIKKHFPTATIVPILIGQQLSPSDLNSLYQKINNYCGRNCLLIASVDFSHYLPARLAEVHDAYTLSALGTQNLDKIFSSEVDSPQSLYLVSRLAQDRGLSFQNIFHTNSGIMAQNSDIETTTHLFSWFRPKLFHLPQPTIYTSLNLPYSIDKKFQESTLGTRFFYGVDQINYGSTLPDFAIATTQTPQSTAYSFFPITRDKNLVSFIRGSKKADLIKKYFDSLPSSPNLTKDYFWGKLIYDTKN